MSTDRDVLTIDTRTIADATYRRDHDGNWTMSTAALRAVPVCHGKVCECFIRIGPGRLGLACLYPGAKLHVTKS